MFLKVTKLNQKVCDKKPELAGVVLKMKRKGTGSGGNTEN